MGDRYYLSEQDRKDRLENALEHMGGDDSSCGGYDPGTVCGGCTSCILAQVSWAFWEERREASRYQAAGLEYVDPNVLPWWSIVTHGGKRAPFHDGFGHMLAGER